MDNLAIANMTISVGGKVGEAALNLDLTTTLDTQGWRLRLAQQAFAALLEDNQRPASFRIASLRASARTRLSALSVDDRGRLQCWLALQLATESTSNASKALDTLATVDPVVSAGVRADLPALLILLGQGSRNSEVSDPIGISRAGRSDTLTQPVCRVSADLLCFRPFFADTGTA